MLQGWTVVQDPSGSMGPYAYKAEYTHTTYMLYCTPSQVSQAYSVGAVYT